MADNLSLLISALLDPKSKSGIENEIKQLQQLFDNSPIKIKLNIDNAQFKQFSDGIAKISGQISKSTQGFIDPVLDQYTKVEDHLKDTTQETMKYTNAQKEQIAITQKVNNETKELLIDQTKTINNYKKQRDEIEKLNRAKDAQPMQNWAKQLEIESQIRKSESDKIKLQMQSNAELDAETSKLEKQIELYKQKMKLESKKITSGRQGEHVDTEALQALNKQIDDLSATTPDAVHKMSQYSVGMKDIDVNAKAAADAVRNVNRDGYGFIDMVTLAAKKVAIWSISTKLIFDSLRQIKDGVKYISELDDALNQIRIVTGKTQKDVAGLAKSYNNLAKEMSVTTKEITNAAVEFYRQGLGDGAVEEKLINTIRYAKISALEFNEAAEILTATVNSMGIDAQRAADVMAYLGDATATGSDEIGRAMQKAGGTAGALGVEFEKLATWIAVVSSRTRESAETIGTSFNTMLARFTVMREKGFDEEDGTKINDVSKALKEVGIALLDSQGNFNDLGGIVDQLGAKWDTLDSRTKAYLATTVAGTRQQSKFYNLMEGYGEVTELYAGALSSFGTSAQKFAVYQESMTAKLDKFRAVWESVVQNTLDSSFLKFFVDAGTGILKIVDAFGLLNTAIIVTIASLLLLHKGFQAFYGQNIAIHFIGLGEAFIKLARNMGIATATAGKLGTALTMIAPIAVLTGILLLIKGVVWLSKETERQAEKVRELKSEYDNLTQSLEDNAEKQKQIKDRLEELYGLRNSNEITQAEKDELTRLENVNTELKKQIEYEEALKQIRGEELERESIKASQRKTISNDSKNPLANLLKLGATDLINPKNSSYAPTTDEKITQDTEKLKLYRDELEKLNKARDEGTVGFEDYTKQKEELTKKISPLTENLDALVKSLEEEAKNYTGATEEGTARKESIEGITTATKDLIIETNNLVTGIDTTVGGLSDIEEASDESAQRQDELSKKIRETQEEFSKYGDSLRTLQTALNELSSGDLSETTLDNLVKSYKELIPYLDDRATLQEKINELIEEEQQKSYEDTLKETTSNLQSLNELQDKLNKSQGISAEVMNDVINKHEELAPYLHSREALENAVSEAIATQEGVQRQSLTNQLMNSTTYFNEQIKGNKTLWNTIVDAYGKDAENFKSLSEAKDKTDVFLVNAIGERWKKLYGTQANALRALINASDGFTTSNIRSEKFAMKNPRVQKQLNDARKQLKALEAIQKALNSSAKTVNFKGVNLSGISSKGISSKGKSSVSSASKTAQKIYKPIIDAYQKISTELDRINALLEENSILTEQAEGSDKIALLQKRVALIKQQENALKRLNTQQKKELNTVKSSLKKKGFQFNSAGDLTNYAQRLSKLTGDAAQEAEELIDRFSELAYGIIPDTNNQILSLGQSVKDIANELEGYVDNVKNLLYEAVKNKYQIEQQIQEAKANIEGLISNARKEELQQRAQQLQDDADFYAERLSELKEFYNREKDLLRKQLQDLKDARDDEKQQEELIKLQNRYNQISLDNSGMFEKEKLDLQQRIADIQEDQYWDALEKNVKAREEEIDSKILLAEQEQEKRVNIAKNAQEAIEESEKKHYAFIQSIMKKGWSGILAYLKANSTQYKNATVTERKIIEQQWQDSYNTMLNKHTDYWTETENLFKKSTSNILTFLKKYSPDFADLGESQGKAYADALRSQINLAKGADTTSVSKIKANTFTSSSGSTSSGSKSTTITQTLKKGAKGSQVSELQRLLNKLGYKVAVDGSFGGETLKAVRAFQKANGLAVDGSVGRLTRAALNSSSSSKPNVSSTSRSLKKGVKGDDVKRLQTALNQILGIKLDVDGSFGSATQNAVKQFQKLHKLTQDGSVGARTKAKFRALGYSEGGKVDFTGLAMLHGSKSKPEVVLNAQQTAIFKDFTKFLNNLVPKTNTNFLKSPAPATSLAGAGSLIGSLVIQVEKLESDTDFDLLGKKVGDSIYKVAKDYGLQFSVPRRR